MSLLLSCLATIGVLVSLISSWKAEQKRVVKFLALAGALVAILIFWGQYLIHSYESNQADNRYNQLSSQNEALISKVDSLKIDNGELKRTLDPILKLAKARNPALDGKDALKSLLNEFEQQLKRSHKEKRASILGITLPGRRGTSLNN